MTKYSILIVGNYLGYFLVQKVVCKTSVLVGSFLGKKLLEICEVLLEGKIYLGDLIKYDFSAYDPTPTPLLLLPYPSC